MILIRDLFKFNMVVKGEARGRKYGRNYAVLIKYIFDTIPGFKRDAYKKVFFEELGKFSLEKRKQGEPKNLGCVHELKDIDEVSIDNPQDLAKLVKDSIHLMYQKNTAERVLNGLLENLQ